MGIDYYRGHEIQPKGKEWVYSNTGEPTVENRRDCGHCGLPDTPEGHDGCIGTLPGVMNACCGHGQEDEAYVQFWYGASIYGKEAVNAINSMKGV